MATTVANVDPRFKEVEEGIAVTLEFSNGRMVQFYAGFGADTLDELHVAGTKGSITLINACRFDVARKLTLQQGDELQVIEFAKTDNFSGMIAYFADCSQTGVTPLADRAEGLADMTAMIAIETAARTQASQSIPQLPPFRTMTKKC